MNGKIVYALGITMSVFATAAVHAESNVRISGLLGIGVSYTSNAGNGPKLQTAGTHATPFISFSGKEDIDGDTSAIFQYRNYVFPNNGTFAPFDTYVGLSSKSNGTLTLGHQFDLLGDVTPYTSERYTSLLATHPGNLDRTVGNSLNNLIKYKSPAYGAFQFGAMYGVGESTSTTNTGRSVGASISHTAGPIQTIAVWESVKGVPYVPRQRLGVSRLYGRDFSTTPTATILQDQNTAAIGAAYTDKGLRMMANYSYTRLSSADVRETAQTIDIGAYKYLTPQVRVGGGYAFTKLDPYKWNQLHLHLDYALSKRTSLYLLSAYQKAGEGQLAVMRNRALSNDSQQMVIEAGINHFF